MAPENKNHDEPVVPDELAGRPAEEWPISADTDDPMLLKYYQEKEEVLNAKAKAREEGDPDFDRFDIAYSALQAKIEDHRKKTKKEQGRAVDSASIRGYNIKTLWQKRKKAPRVKAKHQ